jgi:hypothetical protein
MEDRQSKNGWWGRCETGIRAKVRGDQTWVRPFASVALGCEGTLYMHNIGMVEQKHVPINLAPYFGLVRYRCVCWLAGW